MGLISLVSTNRPSSTGSRSANNPQTAAKIELGKQLYFEPRLSGNNWISCATCHNPVLGFADGLPVCWVAQRLRKAGGILPP